MQPLASGSKATGNGAARFHSNLVARGRCFAYIAFATTTSQPMKKQMMMTTSTPQIALDSRRFLLPLVLTGFLGAVDLVRAQCETEVLSPPTLNSVQVRTLTESGVCNGYFNASLPSGDPCVVPQWTAAGWAGIPGIGTGIEVRFAFDAADACNEIIFRRSVLVVTIDQSFLDAHPEGFRISSNQQFPSGNGVEWAADEEGTDPPALSFEGRVTFGNAASRIDITFTGGTPPRPSIDDLITVVENSNLAQRQRNPLLASLEGARDSFADGDYRTGNNRLHAFQNKVRAQGARFDATLAEALIAAAQAIIDSGAK